MLRVIEPKTAAQCAKWLVPRLETFRQAHPKFDVRVDATDRLVNFERESIDVAVFLADRRYRNENSEIRREVFGDERVPALTVVIATTCDEVWLLEIEAIAVG